MSITLITLFALFANIEASFSSSFAQGYIFSDIMDIKTKQPKTNKKLKTNKEVKVLNCYTFRTPPSNFTKDIIIPVESYFYSLSNTKACVLFTPKSNFTNYKRTCEFKIVDKNAGLGIVFLYSVAMTLGFISFITTCLCGTDEERADLCGFICGSICHSIVRSLDDD